MFSLIRKKQSEQIPAIKEVSANIIAVWSPYGADTSSYSYYLAKDMSNYTHTALIELPCLGIPRLSVSSGIKDRDNHVEAIIIEFEKKRYINMERLTKKSDTLAILPAGYYAVPDSPVVNKVEQETLIDFPAFMINAARNNGYQQVIFECQGQLSNPMTFYILKKADFVLIPIEKPSEVAFALINLKRLLHVYEYEDKKFKIIALENEETLADTMVILDDDGKQIGKPDVFPGEIRQVLALVGIEGLPQFKEEKGIVLKKLFQHGQTLQKNEEPMETEETEKNQKTIRI